MVEKKTENSNTLFLFKSKNKIVYSQQSHVVDRTQTNLKHTEKSLQIFSHISELNKFNFLIDFQTFQII